MTTPVFASELVLANGVAVTAGRLYVIDNKVVVSTVAGTVATQRSPYSAANRPQEPDGDEESGHGVCPHTWYRPTSGERRRLGLLRHR